MSSYFTMAASMSISRFAVLEIDSSDDEEPQKKSNNNSRSSSAPKSKKNKNKKKPAEKGTDQNDVRILAGFPLQCPSLVYLSCFLIKSKLRSLAFGTNRPQKKKQVHDTVAKAPLEQYTQWQEHDKELVDDMFQQELQQAILASTIEHEEKVG